MDEAGAEAASAGAGGAPRELYKGLDAFMAFSVCFTTVAIIPSISTAFTICLEGSHPFFIVWTWVVAASSTIVVGYSMAEICSAHPGSVFVWTAALAPPTWAPALAYACGWFNLLGNTFSAAALAGGLASLCAAAFTVGSGGVYAFSTALTALVSVAILLSWLALSVRRIDFIGKLSNFAAVFQLCASAVMLIVLVASAQAYAPLDFLVTPSFVAGAGGSGGEVIGEDRPSLMVLIALLFSLFSFSGYDSGAQTAAETQDADLAAPRSIITCCCVSALTGLAYICGLLLTTPDNSAVLPEAFGGRGQTDQAIVNIYTQAAGVGGGLFLTALLALCVFFAGQSSLLVASRIAHALASDGCLPRDFAALDAQTAAPVCALLLIVACAAGVLALRAASEAAFGALVEMATVCFQISYAIPIALRCTSAAARFSHGRYRLGAVTGPLIHTCACVWLCCSTLALLAPNHWPLTLDSFNWSPVLLCAVGIILAVAWRWPHGGVRAHIRLGESGALVALAPNAASEVAASISVDDEADIDAAASGHDRRDGVNRSRDSRGGVFHAIATHDPDSADRRSDSAVEVELHSRKSGSFDDENVEAPMLNHAGAGAFGERGSRM